MNNPHKLFFVTFLLISLQFFAQKKINISYNNLSLQEVLKDIENKTQLFFSYDQELIVNKKITLKNATLEIPQLLTTLKQQTGLTFEIVSEKQVIITQKIMLCGYVKDAISK